MKNLSYLILFFLVWSCNQPNTAENTLEEETDTQTTYQEVTMPDSVLRHVVLFGFKATSKPEDIQKIVDAFKELPTKISEIKDFEWGINSSPEGINQGLTHAFFVTFHSDADRDTYLPHPAHKEFVDLVGPHVDKVTVLDYWTKP